MKKKILIKLFLLSCIFLMLCIIIYFIAIIFVEKERSSKPVNPTTPYPIPPPKPSKYFFKNKYLQYMKKNDDNSILLKGIVGILYGKSCQSCSYVAELLLEKNLGNCWQSNSPCNFPNSCCLGVNNNNILLSYKFTLNSDNYLEYTDNQNNKLYIFGGPFKTISDKLKFYLLTLKKWDSNSDPKPLKFDCYYGVDSNNKIINISNINSATKLVKYVIGDKNQIDNGTVPVIFKTKTNDNSVYIMLVSNDQFYLIEEKKIPNYNNIPSILLSGFILTSNPLNNCKIN